MPVYFYNPSPGEVETGFLELAGQCSPLVSFGWGVGSKGDPVSKTRAESNGKRQAVLIYDLHTCTYMGEHRHIHTHVHRETSPRKGTPCRGCPLSTADIPGLFSTSGIEESEMAPALSRLFLGNHRPG